MTRLRFDVVVVGARCAGAPLAALLAKRGVRVALVERARFPRDTLSTHLFEADALAFLDRLGVTPQLRATGAPFVNRTDSRVEGFRASIDWPRQPGDVGGIASVRRHVLDPILVGAAADAGADVRMETTARELLCDGGRVRGVRLEHASGRVDLEASIVVGADGRDSTIAKLCGARRYHRTRNARALYWAYFEGADSGGEPTFVFHRWGDRFVIGCPTDSGLYQVLVLPELAELDGFRRELEPRFMKHACSCEPVAEAIGGARRAGRFLGAVRWTGYLREPSGPGWLLAGDAGHFKDPAAGRGIADAFRQADSLAPAIVDALGSADPDRTLARWGRARDRLFVEHHWFGADLGRAGPVPAVLPEFLSRLEARGKLDSFFEIQNHRALPSKVVTPGRVLGATAAVLGRRGTNRARVANEVRSAAADQLRRRWYRWRPDYEADGPEG